MNKRAVVLGTSIVFGFVLVVVRLADLMLLNHDRLVERARRQYEVEKTVEVYRGGIYDRRGREWAVDVDSLSAYCNPLEVESAKKAAKAISKAAGTSYRAVYSKMSSDKNFVWVRRKLTMDEAEEVKALGLEGIGFVPEVKRLYPKKELASHVVGFVGIDNQPLGGVELQYGDSLKGKAGKVAYSKDAAGRTLSGGLALEGRGSSVVLTIDEGLQYILEKELDAAMRKWEASSVSAIMMNPFSGEIFAMANRPTYDPNEPASYTDAMRRNRAITDTYEPGSTFKIVAAAAALEENLVDTSTEFDCSKGFIRIGRRTIWDSHKHDKITFKEVIQTSSNVGTIMVGQMVGEEKFYQYMRKFGFGSRTGIDLPAESKGVVRPTEKWSDSALGSMSIGYGVGVTPLQVLRAYSAVANGGLLVKPHVVKEIISPEGSSVYRFSASENGGLERVLSRGTAETLRGILVSVTGEGGTARAASVDGNKVAGKTGTARLIDSETGTYSTERYASSFVGFVPADNPKIALIVVVFEPQEDIFGGHVAAPVFRGIAENTLAYLNVPRDDVFEDNVLVVRNARGYN